MHDVDRVRGRQRVGDLRPEVTHLPPRHTPRAAVALEAASADQLGDEIGATVGQGPVVERAGDIGMIELRRRHRLAREAGCDLLVAGELGVDDLERDLLAQAQVLRQVHRAHATLAEQLADLVATIDGLTDPGYVRRGGLAHAGGSIRARLRLHHPCQGAFAAFSGRTLARASGVNVSRPQPTLRRQAPEHIVTTLLEEGKHPQHSNPVPPAGVWRRDDVASAAANESTKRMDLRTSRLLCGRAERTCNSPAVRSWLRACCSPQPPPC